MFDKKSFLALINSNILRYGYHITIVNSNTIPRYAYSIGLQEMLGFELIFAGGIMFLKDDVTLIFDRFVEAFKMNKGTHDQQVEINGFGSFSLVNADSSWTSLMALGVFDYYKTNEVEFFQIIPDKEHYTLDIPDMKKIFEHSSQPVWKWLAMKWDYSVPKNSTVVTNIDALFGKKITEVTRWEDDEWETFAGAGQDIEKEEVRVVSLGTILGLDITLLPALELNIGKGLWRDESGQMWNEWA